MNILVLHNVDDLARARRSTLDFIFAFERYQPGHCYHYQKITDPPPAEVVSTHWDAVIFESTSLGIVTIRPREHYLRLRERWAFLKAEQIIKIAFPQDDANCGGLMDDWFEAWGFHYVYSVRAPEHWPVLYPKSSKSARFVACLSGYIDDNSLADLTRFSKPWSERSRLIGQRVTMYPPRGGRQGRLKGLIAEAVKSAAGRKGLKADISTHPGDTLLGDAWYAFLGDCKYALGTEGGLSLNDPYGEIADRIAAYVAANPVATFEEIEAACFPGLDGVHVFSGFSPRVLEAAICQASQVLVEGWYLGVLEPGTHYLNLKQDLSNIDAVLDELANEDSAKARIRACQETLVESPRFRFSTLAAMVLKDIADLAPGQMRANAPDPALIRRGYVKVLAEEARADGFCWPELGDRVASQIERQRLPDGLQSSQAGSLGPWAKVQVLIAEMTALKARLVNNSPAAVMVDTLTQLAEGLEAAIEQCSGQVLPAALEATFAAMIDAFDKLTFDLDQAGELQPIAPLLTMAGVAPGAARLMDQVAGLPAESDMARFVAGLAKENIALTGLASRLAPSTGSQFSAEEVALLRAIDELVVQTASSGLSPVFRQLAQGRRGEQLLAALEGGGDAARLVLAVTAASTELIGLTSRLAPVSGEAYSEAELVELRFIDELIVRTRSAGLDRVLDLLRHLDGGDAARLVEGLFEARGELADLVGYLAPRDGARFSEDELTALRELERFLGLAGGHIATAFGPKPNFSPKADRILVSAEVLDWPFAALALMVLRRVVPGRRGQQAARPEM